MTRIAIHRNLVMKRGSQFPANPEMALLGGLVPALNQTRVMAANIQSSFTRPADLDAFLQGQFKAC